MDKRSHKSPPKRDRPKPRLYPAERAKAFIDAVVAIAMTLLILPLMESASDFDRSGSFGGWFEENGGHVFTFILSFVLIGWFWLGHHRLFTEVEYVSTPLLWTTILWLLTIVWLPVATALTGHHSGLDPVVVSVYIGSLFAISLTFLGIRIYLALHPALHRSSALDIQDAVQDGIVTVVMIGLAWILTLIFPGLNYFSMCILMFTRPMRMLASKALGRIRPPAGTAVKAE